MVRMRLPTVETYNLFGESEDLPDVVHCETIATRSILHNWEFAAHRHARLHQFLLIESGGGEARFEDQAIALSPQRIINVPIGHVHGFSFIPGTQGWVVTLAAETVSDALTRGEGITKTLAEPCVFDTTDAIRAIILQIFEEFAGRHFARAQILRGYCGALIGLVARALAETGVAPSERPNSDLLERFEGLVETHFAEQWSVAEYAKALSVSPTHLSRITRWARGYPASRLIHERLIREARRNLVYTSMPISTISYALGFEDPAYFSRVFTGATGFSPRDFRNRVQGKAT